MKINKNVQYTIFCDMCGEMDAVNKGDFCYDPNTTPIKYFRERGWHDSKGKTICHNCFDEVKNNH